MAAMHECPKADALQRFLLGQSSPELTDEIERHLADCKRCIQAAAQVEADDDLVAAMRDARTCEVEASPETVDALIPWLKRLRPSEPSQTTDFTAASDHVGSAATYDFLAPAFDANEMGRLDQYRILESIGAGGMGMVFLAEDTRLQRRVALKVIKPDLLHRHDLQSRFLEEARAIASVEHDHIVSIYEARESDGIPYLVMPFLQGESLEHRLKKSASPCSAADLLRIGAEIAEGLEAAHRRGLIHRDIKPSNLWMESDESGRERIKILDFGLAKTVEGASDSQRAIQGTPAYMAPEQARGLPVDARADLFSLGCVLYRMAVGRAPFVGESALNTIFLVATETPPSPKALNRSVPAPISDLIDRLLAKEPNERPKSAKEVADALRAIERSLQPSRTKQWVAAVAASLIVVALLSAWVVSARYRPAPPIPVKFATDEPDLTLLLRSKDGKEHEVRIDHEAKLDLEPGAYSVRLKIPRQHRRLEPSTFIVAPDQPAALSFRLVGLIRTLQGHSLGISGVAFAGDDRSAVSAGLDQQLLLWKLGVEEDPKSLKGSESPLRCVAVSPDGSMAIAGSGKPLPRQPDAMVRVWDLRTQTLLAELAGHESSVVAVAFDRKGKRFASGDRSGVVHLWNAETWKLIRRLQAVDRCDVVGIAFLPDGDLLVAGSDGNLIRWSDQGVPTRNYAKQPLGLTGLSVSAEGKHAATSHMDGSLRVWDLITGESHAIAVHENEATCIAYSADGSRLLSGGSDGAVRLWNAQTGEKLEAMQGHQKAVRSVAFSSEGRRALSGGADGKLMWWELPK
jgi:serine/threonine protein kinase